MKKKYRYTTKVHLPVEIVCYGQVEVVTDQPKLGRIELAKLFATQLKLWATGTCVHDVVKLDDFELHNVDYREHIESAFSEFHPAKNINLAVKFLKDDMQHKTYKGEELT